MDSNPLPHILYVDDEQANLRVFKFAFQREYKVSIASTGKEALELLNTEKIDLIITDQKMPKMTGIELLKLVAEAHPYVMRMIMSGHSEMEEVSEAEDRIGIDRYIQKPWSHDPLKKILEEEFTRYFAKQRSAHG